MRENIGIFRGKRCDNGEWVEGALVIANDKLNKGKCYILHTPSDFSYGDNGNRIRIGCFIEVNADTIGECTGLRDKNDKLAFEHDVTEDQLGRRWIIFGCEGGFGICRDTEWTRNAECSVIIWNALADAQNAEWFSKQHKIIGNIHDNGELLKEGADNG